MLHVGDRLYFSRHRRIHIVFWNTKEFKSEKGNGISSGMIQLNKIFLPPPPTSHTHVCTHKMAKRLNSDFRISRPSLPPPSLSTPPFLYHTGSDSVLILKYYSVAMGHFKFKLGMRVEGIASNDRESEIRLYFLQTSNKYF